MKQLESNRTLNNHKLIFSIDINKNGITIDVKIPKKYSSKLTKYLVENEDGNLAHLSMKWNHRSLQKLSISEDIKESLNEIEKNCQVSFLHEFYVYTNNEYTTPEESKALKGIGYEMLCIAISNGIDGKYITQKTLLALEADGGDCNIPLDIPLETALLELYNNYRYELAKLLYDNIRYNEKTDLIEYLCVIKENARLVEYYTKLGFNQVNKGQGSAVFMIGKILDIQKNCISSYNSN